MVGIGGLIGHLTSGIDWDLLLAGSAGRLDDDALLGTIAAILVLAVQAILG